MRKIRLALALTSAFVASAALAQDYDRAGMYGQLNGVAAIDNFDGVPSSALDTAIGVSGRIGYRLDPRLAVEGQIEYSGDFIGSGADLTATLVTVNGKFYFLQDQIQPYALAGIGGAFGHVDIPGLGSDEENAFVVKFGGGLDFYLNDQWGLAFEAVYNLGTGDFDDLDYTSIGWGAFYRF
jgi:opacity protein-like surface antigen